MLQSYSMCDIWFASVVVVAVLIGLQVAFTVSITMADLHPCYYYNSLFSSRQYIFLSLHMTL